MNLREKILVVDDEPTVCRAIAMMLVHMGYSVETAADGRSALEKFTRGTFDLVMTDLSMPEMRGDELAVHIRQMKPSQKIVMVTAFAEEYRRDGMPNIDALLDKPFTLVDLKGVINQVLAREG